MHIVAAMMVGAIISFALISAVREVRQYNRYLQGEVQYLVSKQRRNRRLLISIVLLIVSLFLFLGFFVLSLHNPLTAILFWFIPLALTLITMYLGMLDFRETSRDLDHIFREAADKARKIAQENQQKDTRTESTKM